MATVSQVVSDMPIGDRRMKIIRVTPTSAAITFDSGVQFIDFASATPKSVSDVADADLSFAYNSGESGTSLAGYIGMSNCSTADTWDIQILYSR